MEAEEATDVEAEEVASDQASVDVLAPAAETKAELQATEEATDHRPRAMTREDAVEETETMATLKEAEETMTKVEEEAATVAEEPTSMARDPEETGREAAPGEAVAVAQEPEVREVVQRLDLLSPSEVLKASISPSAI